MHTEDYRISEMELAKDDLIRASLYTNLLKGCFVVDIGVKRNNGTIYCKSLHMHVIYTVKGKK